MDNVDLEILASLGEPTAQRGQTKRKRPQARRKAASDFSDSEEIEFSSDDADDDVNSDDEDEEDDDVKEVKAWGDDLMGDEEDRRRLYAMNDLDRERALADRAEKRQKILDRIELKKKLKGTSSQKKNDTSDRRTSSRKSTKKTSKSLRDLKRQRDEKSSRRPDRDSDNDRNKGYYSSQSENEEEGEVDSPGATAMDWKSESKEKATLEQIQSITISRNELEKWAYAKFFKETIQGCFLRVGLGVNQEKKPIYRVTQINDVVEYHRNYQLGKITTRKALSLSHGKARKVFLMDVVSNQPITEARPVTIIFSNDEIEEMVREKQAVLKAPGSGAEKIRLLRLLNAAEEENDEQSMREIREQLAKMEEMALETRKMEENWVSSLTKPSNDSKVALKKSNSFAMSTPAKRGRQTMRKLPLELSSFVRVEEIVFGNDEYIKNLDIDKLKSLLKPEKKQFQ
ncbi:hypothetical protein BC829DRAFT_394915 [Chytridium lagenaria]|nr:hypothetical protein BC829DRAFT_394915 [Chytridium lagenaria]